MLGWRKVGGNVGRFEKKCLGVGEGVGSLLRSGEKWGDDVREVRKDVGVGRSVERGEGNVWKYGEVLENVGEMWESVLKCGGGVGSVGKHGVCVWGVGRGVGSVLGWEEVRRSGGVGRCWERSRECEKVWGEVRCGGCWG